MARTTAQIQSALAASSKSINPSLDTAKGAIYNFMLAPLGPVLEELEENVEHLRGLYSTVFSSVATPEEVEALGTSFVISRDSGHNATVIQHFIRTSQPAKGTIHTVPKGTLVSNSDGSLIFRTLEEITMDGDNAFAYYNAARGLYEISVKAEAVSSGEAYNLPSFRINKKISSISGFDLTENRSDASGGTEKETDKNLVSRIEAKFSGLNLGTVGGLKSTIVNLSPSYVKGVSVVQPGDVEFRRVIQGLALDIFVIGEQSEITEDVFTAEEGDYIFTLVSSPVLDLVSTTVNGTEVTANLSKDVNETTKLSVNSVNYLVLDTPVTEGDIVVCQYNYNKLIATLQDELKDRIFGTDILVREAIKVETLVEAKARITISSDALTLQTALESKITELIETETFVERLLPSKLEEAIRDSMVGVLSFSWTKFTRKSGGFLDIEPIELAANESAKLSSENLKITVVKA